MAFWKKSEDPWDIDPKKRKKAVAPVTESALEQEKTVPPWVQKKDPPAPMSCPWCGRNMVWGNLFCNGRTYGMIWEEGERKSFLESFGTDAQTKRLDLEDSEEAWYCTECRKLIMDIQVAMSRSGPNYIWKDGKIIFPKEEEDTENDL